MNIKLPNTVINFHVINDIQWMEEVLLLLKRHYRFVSANDLERYYYGDLNLKNACHITVDDGDKSVYEHLFPLIQKHRVPISIYVSPKSIITGNNFWFQELKSLDLKLFLDFYNEMFGTEIGYVNDLQVKAKIKSLNSKTIYQLIDNYKKKLSLPYLSRIGMDLEQIRELRDSGLVEIGAHTQTHPILKNEDEKASLYEIKSSIEELSDLLGFQVMYFAYPNGIPNLDFTTREVKILKECGIRLAFSTENKRLSKGDNPLSIPRNGITKGSKNFILAKLVFGNTWIHLRKVFKGKQEFDYRSID